MLDSGLIQIVQVISGGTSVSKVAIFSNYIFVGRDRFLMDTLPEEVSRYAFI